MFDRLILAEIDQLKAQLDALRPLPKALLNNLREVYDVRLTHNSTAIEGNTLTQSETQIVLEKGITVSGKSLKDHLEVVNHAQAITFIRDLAQTKESISEWEIRQIHSLICRGDAEAGVYRTINVMAAGSDHRYPDHLQVADLMNQFIHWLQSPTGLHPVELASEVHYRFVTIHPFHDGNGRTARLLMNLILLRFGYPIVVLKVVERSAYIDRITTWRLGDDAPLKQMIAQAAKASLEEVLDLAQ
ncbi:Fic family protein [filamentous cyanobacterium LEGE 11480]|uniref:Fic family protein n=1 Tax=Romeriopsis navalis LEGE 11480 TaxID=2777977 RepID=A0A928VUC6_9CYAN|nr:Fic family protein [Romeriopsis navalis]MBE9032740.1 Fic family protein [Romeriopsis navalis LEGE 11480]